MPAALVCRGISISRLFYSLPEELSIRGGGKDRTVIHPWWGSDGP